MTFLRGVADALAHADRRYVIAAVALHLGGLVVTGQRWKIVAVAFAQPITLLRATVINLAGIFVRNATPTTGLGGDASRIALLRLEGLTLAQATATFVYVRTAEFPAMTVVVGLALPTLSAVVGRSTRPAAAIAAAAIVGVGIGWLARRRLRAGVTALRDRARRLQIPRATFVGAVALAAAAQAETIVRQIAVAAAFAVPLTIQQSAMVTALGIAGGLVPTVGSIGAVEGSIAAGLIMCGAPADTAVAITLVERAISYGLSTLLGAGALAALGGRAALRFASATRDAVGAG